MNHTLSIDRCAWAGGEAILRAKRRRRHGESSFHCHLQKLTKKKTSSMQSKHRDLHHT